MQKLASPLFSRQDQVYFNCLHSEIYSYMQHKQVPIHLLLYNCLEEPKKIYDQIIVQGNTRWSYPFTIFSEEDFKLIGQNKITTTGTFSEIKPLLHKAVEHDEITFLCLNPFYLPYRDENVHGITNRRHWVMIAGYDYVTNNYIIYDEKYTYYEQYELNEQVLMEAYANGPQRVISFQSMGNNYSLLKQKYNDFFKQYGEHHDQFFDEVIPLLKRQASENHAIAYSDHIYQAYNFFSGSLQITRQFLQQLKMSSEITDLLRQMSKSIENVSSIIKKYELTKRINYSYIEEKLVGLKQLFRAFINYMASSQLQDVMMSISLSEIAQQSTSSANSTISDQSIKKYIKQLPLDLSSLFNNQGIGLQHSAADLTGGKEYLQISDDHFLTSVSHNGIELQLQPNLGQGNDNISCQEQVINIEGNCYNEIFLLACAEWGDSTTTITVKYENGREEEVMVQMTDWAWPPKYGETIALSFPIFRETALPFTPEKGYLFSVSYPIQIVERAVQLILPYSPNLHIFAITLTYENE